MRELDVRLITVLFCLFTTTGCRDFSNQHHPVSNDPGASAESILRRASGACLAKVVRLEEKNEMPSDGDHFVKAWLKIEDSTGEVPDFLYLVIQYGGMMPVEVLQQVDANLSTKVMKHDSLKVGERHWLIFSKDDDPAKFPPGVAGWWRYSSADVPADVVKAIQKDRFHDHPIWDESLNLVSTWRQEGTTATITVRKADSTGASATVFEQTVNGVIHDVSLMHYSTTYEMDWPEGENSHFVHVTTVGSLAEKNEFQLPAGNYRINYAFHLESGRLACQWVAADQENWLMYAFRQHGVETGELEIEMRFELLSTGGKKVGCDSDEWYRRSVRRYESGVLKSTQIYRHRYIKTGKEPVYSSTDWLLISD